MVSMDMQVWTWPNLPHADEADEWLNAEPFAEGYELRGPYFGGDPYGNGAIHVMEKDVIWEHGGRITPLQFVKRFMAIHERSNICAFHWPRHLEELYREAKVIIESGQQHATIVGEMKPRPFEITEE